MSLGNTRNDGLFVEYNSISGNGDQYSARAYPREYFVRTACPYSRFSTGMVPHTHELVVQESTNSTEEAGPTISAREEMEDAAGQKNIRVVDRIKDWMWEKPKNKAKSWWAGIKEIPRQTWRKAEEIFSCGKDGAVATADTIGYGAKMAYHVLSFQKDKADLLKLERQHKQDSKRPIMLQTARMNDESWGKVKEMYERQGMDASTKDADSLFYLPWDERTHYEKENAGGIHTRLYLSIDGGNAADMARFAKMKRWEKSAEERLDNDKVRYHFILNDPDYMEHAALLSDRLWRVSPEIVNVAEMPRMVFRDGLHWDMKGTSISPTEVDFIVGLPGYDLVDFDYDKETKIFKSVNFFVTEFTPAELKRKEKDDRWTVSTNDNRTKQPADAPELPDVVTPKSPRRWLLPPHQLSPIPYPGFPDDKLPLGTDTVPFLPEPLPNPKPPYPVPYPQPWPKPQPYPEPYPQPWPKPPPPTS